MFCIHCGKEIEDGSSFCCYCGKTQSDQPEKTHQTDNSEDAIKNAPGLTDVDKRNNRGSNSQASSNSLNLTKPHPALGIIVAISCVLLIIVIAVGNMILRRNGGSSARNPESAGSPTFAPVASSAVAPTAKPTATPTNEPTDEMILPNEPTEEDIEKAVNSIVSPPVLYMGTERFMAWVCYDDPAYIEGPIFTYYPDAFDVSGYWGITLSFDGEAWGLDGYDDECMITYNYTSEYYDNDTGKRGFCIDSVITIDDGTLWVDITPLNFENLDMGGSDPTGQVESCYLSYSDNLDATFVFQSLSGNIKVYLDEQLRPTAFDIVY